MITLLRLEVHSSTSEKGNFQGCLFSELVLLGMPFQNCNLMNTSKSSVYKDLLTPA